LSGEKKVLNQMDVVRYEVPKLPELAMTQQWPEAIQWDVFRQHMPDEYCGDAKTPRDFFWSVFATLAPLYVSTLVDKVVSARQEAKKATRDRA
jgi:hypothetical protein